MHRSPLARLGLAVLTAALCATGLAAPAQAAADTGTLAGHLHTHTGGPAAGATVNVYETTHYDLLGSGSTDRNGHYEVPDLAAGKVKIEFKYHGYVQWAGGADEETAKVFTITKRATTTVNEKLAALGLFTGRLVDRAGKPASSVPVIATDGGGAQAGDDMETDADGRWTRAVPPDVYTISFELSNGRQWVEGTQDEQQAHEFTIADGQSITVNETLLPTGTISGRLVDATNKAVDGATVTLYDGDSDTGEVTTAPDGTYAFSRVFPGSYTVQFEPESAPTQWAYGKYSRATATPIQVEAGDVTTVDDKLLTPGTITGQFTTAHGKPIGGADIKVFPSNGSWGENQFTAETDAQGRYTVTDVPPGSYTVQFTDPSGRAQYAYGSGSLKGATAIAVKSGTTTTVDDTQVAPASVRVTAVDAATGKTLRSFCVWVSEDPNGKQCTKKAVVLVKNLPADRLSVEVKPPLGSLYLSRSDLRVTTEAGETSAVTAKLQLGGGISTHTVSRSTGKPVPRTCFDAVVPGRGGLPEYGQDCNDAKGNSLTGPLAPGVYNLFVTASGSYGDQWLGNSGGTGDQRAAAKITVRAGKVTAAPKVKLDKAGKISGTVTTANGRHPLYGDVDTTASGYYDSSSSGATINRRGRYTLRNLGPYKWPLVFTTDQSRQWSGGKGNRYAATTVKVVAGKTVRHDEVMREPVKLAGTVRMHHDTIIDGQLTAYTVGTGDAIGGSLFEADGTYTMLVPGGEQVKLGYAVTPDIGDYLEGWYDHAPTYEKATVVDLPASGSKTVDVTVD